MFYNTLLILGATLLSMTSALPQQEPLHHGLQPLGLTEPVAVKFDTSTSHITCDWKTKDFSISDGVCAHLSGQSMRIKSITNTCRVFIYKNTDCTGKEKQMYFEGYQCEDAGDWFSIKAFCH